MQKVAEKKSSYSMRANVFWLSAMVDVPLNMVNLGTPNRFVNEPQFWDDNGGDDAAKRNAVEGSLCVLGQK